MKSDRPDPARVIGRVSVAVPLYNEELVLPEFMRRLTQVLAAIPGGPHEMVFVDDGSTDRTFELLCGASEADGRIRAISLSRNFGHQAALSAALAHTRGDVVVVMDGDLQDRPEAIPQLLDAWAAGFDVVYAQRVDRKESWFLLTCYFLFYRVIALLSDIRLPLDAGDFALLSRRVVDRLSSLPEHHRYLRGLRTWVGFRQCGIPIVRDERFSGRTKYGFFRLLKLAGDGIFAFSVAPLRAATMLGGFTSGLSMLYAAYALYVKVAIGHSPQGFTALILALTFFSGVQLLFLGVIGEYVGRIYEETKGRPEYVIGRLVEKGIWINPTPESIGRSTTSIGGGVRESV